MRSLDRKYLSVAFVCVLTALYIFSGCNPQWHIERADTHVKKAEKKGAVITNDTTYIYGDTIITSYYRDSIQVVEKIITNTVFVEGEVRYITRKDKRREYRDSRKRRKHDFRLKKQEIKAEVKKARRWSLFWIGLITGSLLTIILKLLWNKYLKFFIRK